MASSAALVVESTSSAPFEKTSDPPFAAEPRVSVALLSVSVEAVDPPSSSAATPVFEVRDTE